VVLEGDATAGARVDERIADLGRGSPAANAPSSMRWSSSEPSSTLTPLTQCSMWAAADDEARVVPFADGRAAFLSAGIME
jgi:hypothetical protein